MMWKYVFMSLGPALVAWGLVDQFLGPETAGAVGISVAIVVFIGAEAVAASSTSIGGKTIRHDLAHAALSGLTAQICVMAFSFGLKVLDREVVSWPLAAQVVCIVVVSDFLAYWGHRAQHRIEWLWAPHALHHTPSKLYWLNGLRAHPGDTIWAFFISTLWALVAGFSVEAFAISSVVTTSHLLIQHTRLSFPRYLEAVLVTPKWHHIHHERTSDIEMSNLSQIFTLWDRFFGTYRASAPPPASLGIEDDVAETLVGELALPWTLLRRRSDPPESSNDEDKA